MRWTLLAELKRCATLHMFYVIDKWIPGVHDYYLRSCIMAQRHLFGGKCVADFDTMKICSEIRDEIAYIFIRSW